MEATNNVTIVTAATSMIDYNGAVLIKLFGQGLDFTKNIYKGLINPYQCISFCFQCINDPNDTTNKFALYANNFFLPLWMQVTIVQAESFYPSDD